MNKESETFVIHVVALDASPKSARMTMHPLQAAQITVLKQDEAFIKVSSKYTNYADVFFFNLAMELPENTGINKHTIKLQDGKQLPYRLIYSLGQVELKTLKIYIKTYLKAGFIWSFRSSTDALIIFNKKPGGKLWLYINYQGLNNLTIKNWSPLPLIGEALDWLGRSKQFT